MENQPVKDQKNSENIPLSAMPPQNIVASSVVSEKKPKLRILIAILSTVIITILISSTLYFSRHNKQLSPYSVSQNNTTTKSKIDAATLEHTYRLYQAYAGTRGSASKLTLTDHTGEVVKAQAVKIPMHLMAELNNKYFILKEDDNLATASPNDYGGHYWLMDNTGKMDPINQGVDDALRKHAGGNNPVSPLYPVFDKEVLYYQCDSNIDQYCGTLHKLNILSGASDTYNAGQGDLIGVSEDGSTAYLFDLQNINYYNLANKKITKRVKLPTLPQGARQIWISPNGSYIAYADEMVNKIGVFSTQSSAVVQIGLPKSWDLSSWSGEVIGPVPEWSPDEKNIAFVAWDKTTQCLVRVNVANKSYAVAAKLDISKDAPGTQFGRGYYHHSYDSIGWYNSSALDASAVVSQSVDGFGVAFTNSSFNLNNELTPLPATNGNLLYPNFPKIAIQ
jgi:hypothetical protein